MVDKIVDEDWKKRARAEKDALTEKHKEPEAPAKGAAPGGAGGKPTPHPAFLMILQQLATQALFHLGLVDDGSGMAHPPDLQQARGSIQLLEALELKTRGNLTRDEDQALKDTLQDVRMAFVEMSRRAGGVVPPGPPG